MTIACPNGHESETTDYCDVCGMPIPGASGPAPEPVGRVSVPQPVGPASPQAEPPPSEDENELDTSPAMRRDPCPVCQTPHSGHDRFCETCGFDFSGPPPASLPVTAAVADPPGGPADWEVVVAADRAQCERQSWAGEFPADYPERRYELSGAQLRIGRSRPGKTAPEIDLAGTPSDPGISHLHAALERQADGTYALRDLGSTNGTCLNEGVTEVGTDAAVPVGDGDRIHLGAWTTITLHRRLASA